jgi:hypothetical protein
VEKSLGKHTLGRSRRKSEDITAREIRERRCEDGRRMNLVQERVQNGL